MTHRFDYGYALLIGAGQLFVSNSAKTHASDDICQQQPHCVADRPGDDAGN